MRFCPKCGKKGIKTDFCSDCFQEENGLEFKDIEIVKCDGCNRFFYKNRWKEYENTEKGMIDTALLKIKNPKNLHLNIVPLTEPFKNKPGAKQDVEFKIKVQGEEYIIPARLCFRTCTSCSRKESQYFEGVVQLRDINADLENFVKQDLAAAELQGVHIAKQHRKKDMWDIWLTSQKYMRQLGKKLQKRFGGELVESAKLFTRNKQTSKDVYRLNVMFRLRPYKIGDIVNVKGRKVKIKTLSKRISGVDIETGKKVFVEW